MIEITTLQFFSIIGGCFATGLTAGLTVGYKFSNKTVTTAEVYCNTPKDTRYGRILATRIFANGKATDINCFYLQNKGICEYTGKKCKYL